MARILIVEDEFLIALSIEATLEAEGHEVLRASDGRKALSVMDQHVPDLILTDYMMPRLDGAELVQAVRADDRLARIPIVMLSATPAENIAAKGLAIQQFLSKPIDDRALVTAIRGLLDSRAGPAHHDA